jgi:hypothetical protein
MRSHLARAACARERPHIIGGGLELMRVGIRVGQDGGDSDTLPAQLLDDVAVEVLNGQHPQRRARTRPVHVRRRHTQRRKVVAGALRRARAQRHHSGGERQDQRDSQHKPNTHVV